MAGIVERVDGNTHLRIPFHAPPVVKAFIEDPTVVTGYFGPFGCAKTSAGAMKAFSYSQVYPGARGVIIRATWPELRDTTMKTFFEWFPDGVAGRYEATPKTFWLHTGEGQPPMEVMFRAMDDIGDIANVLSLDIAWAWIDEPQGGVSLKEDGKMRRIVKEPGIAHNLFRALLGRLGRQRGYPKMAWLTGNPPPPSHWIATEFGYDPGDSGHDAPRNRKIDRRLYLGTQDTNRHNLPPGYYEDLERDYGRDTPMARRFLRGQWIEFATEKPFRGSDIQTYGHEGEPELPQGLIVEAGLDPAISEKDTAATSAIVVAGQVRRAEVHRGRIFELFHEEGHWTPYQLVGRMLAAHRAFKVRVWRIEDVAFQRVIGHILEHEARQAGLTLVVDPVKPDADKIRRANAWSAMVEDGTILFRDRESPLCKAMLAVPGEEQAWNLVDAGGHCFRGFPRIQPLSSKVPDLQPEAATARAASYATKPAGEPRPLAPSAVPRSLTKPIALKRAAGYAVRHQPPAKIEDGTHVGPETLR